MKKTTVIRTLFYSALTLQAALIAFVIWIYNGLPAQIPIHFGISGSPDRWADKIQILVLPGISVGIHLLLVLLARRPDTFNYPVTITATNRERVYHQGVLLLYGVLLGIITIMLLIIFAIYRSAKSAAAGIPSWWIIGLLLLPIITGFVSVSKMKKNG